MSEQGIPVVGPILNKIIGTRNERFVKRYTARVNAIKAQEQTICMMTDAELREQLAKFRARYDAGEKETDLITDVFAIAREAMDRGVGIRNIFNPAHEFDPGVLSAEGRALYEQTKEQAASMPVVMPRTCIAEAPEGGAVPDEADEYLGCTEPVFGWMQVDIPPALYEAVREAYPESRPPFRARPFDVQLIGAMVLAGGKIAEMKTGEGKTIVAPLACYLACIEHLHAHVVTVNDYLVQRDRDWVYPFFRALGITVGAIHPLHMQNEDVKRLMYRCDVVYGTTSEFGFDYLRDNMKRATAEQVQRKRQFAIVDEVDSILIDEARTPLIISGPAHDDEPRYELADRLARMLVEKQRPWQEADDKVTACKERIKGLEGDIRQTREHEKIPEMKAEIVRLKKELPEIEEARDRHVQYYEKHEDRKQCHLTHEGIAEAQREAGLGSFYVDENMDIPHLLEQSIRAHAVYQRDRDYVIMNVPDRATGKTEASVVIVDIFTGRPMIGRQWSDGLHQAIEAKEKVPIKEETQTVATVTIQNFYKMYKRLAGMTGTADTEAQEFHDIYKLDVVSIPTNQPMIREDHEDLMFLRVKDKWSAIVDEIKRFHDVGLPILVGTTSVEKSETLSQMLSRKHGIKHEVLNAKQHEREAHIIVGAGQLGAVMIATNMAGRGTDIKLGAITREQMLEHWLKRGVCSRTLTVEATEAELRENVYRKVATQYLDIKKREAEEMPFAELEIQLLRHWAMEYTWLSPRKIDSMKADELREELDEHGRFLLHNIRWYESIEDMGGLHVIGTERHEARRIDNQLRGRSGRQGDNGSSRFFVSLEDDLMKMFAGETTMKVLAKLGMKEGDAIEHPMLSKSVERAQRKVEENNFQVRKNILEYDEVMEHQRRGFYGLRQRVLEGRDVKGLMFEYIEDAIDRAIEEYMDDDYPAQCAAEYAKERLDCSILPERLRGRDRDEMDMRIRAEAKRDARGMIDVTLGEYIPLEGSEISVDFDSAGLINWAKSRFGVELRASELRTGGAAQRKRVEQMLVEAAEEKIDEADLSGLDEYLTPNYGAEQLAKWADRKFGITVSVEEIATAHDDEEDTPARILMEESERLYRKREIEDPVEFAMEMTMALMRQDPQRAISHLVNWANNRYGLDWTEQKLRQTPPQKIREELLAASEVFVAEDRLGHEIEAALACADDKTLDEHLKDRFGVELPETMQYLEDEERDNAIRALIENILRAELLYFERTVLLETLDQAWKDHLYAMDQLRDSISFRAFSQQDPRIEYKREGSQLFTQMMDTVRDRVTDFVFKVKVSPAPPPSSQSPPTPRPQPSRATAPKTRPVPVAARPVGSAASGAAQVGLAAGGAVGGLGSSTITGPGLDAGQAAAKAPSNQEQPQQDAAAGAETAREDAEAPADPRSQVEAARAARARDRKKKRRR